MKTRITILLFVALFVCTFSSCKDANQIQSESYSAESIAELKEKLREEIRKELIEELRAELRAEMLGEQKSTNNNATSSSVGSTTHREGNFHVVAGCFKVKRYAERLQQELQSEGYNSKILSYHGMIMVTFQSYETQKEAQVALNKVVFSDGREGWIYEYNS